MPRLLTAPPGAAGIRLAESMARTSLVVRLLGCCEPRCKRALILPSRSVRVTGRGITRGDFATINKRSDYMKI